METNKNKNGLAIAGMVIGIVSLLISFCGGGFLGIVGLILSIVAITKGKSKGMSIAGIATSSIAIVISILVLMLGGSFINSIVEEANNASYTGNNDEILTPAENKEEKNIYSIGDTFDYYGEKITFTDFKEYNYPDFPQDGLKYYIVTISVENTGDSQWYVSQYDFNFYGDNEAGDLFNLPSDCDFSDAELSPGKKKTGHLIFEVPSESEHITIEYMPNEYFSNQVIVFEMQ